ncbi:unnamed protein product [Cercospora beticola]|nr:unnamed protein product [Cercospora beticola]
MDSTMPRPLATEAAMRHHPLCDMTERPRTDDQTTMLVTKRGTRSLSPPPSRSFWYCRRPETHRRRPSPFLPSIPASSSLTFPMQLARVLLHAAAIPLQYLDRPQYTAHPPRGIHGLVYRWKRSVHFLFDETEEWLLRGSTSLSPQQHLQADAQRQWRIEVEAAHLSPVLERTKAGTFLLLFIIALVLLPLSFRQEPQLSLQWERPAVPPLPLSGSLRSLSRAAPLYSLPWLARDDSPVPRPRSPPRALSPWTRRDLHPVFKHIDQGAKKLEHHLQELHEVLWSPNFLFFEATDSNQIDSLITLLSQPRRRLAFPLQLHHDTPSGAEQALLSTVFDNAAGALKLWSNTTRTTTGTTPRIAIKACSALISQLDRLLDRAVSVVIEAAVSHRRGPHGEQYGDQCALHSAWLEHLDYLHAIADWAQLQAMNVFVAEQRHSAMSFFASRVLRSLQAEEVSVMSSRSAARTFCERLRLQLYRGKHSDLVRAAGRAGLFASKFWAKKEEITHQQAADILTQQFRETATLPPPYDWIIDSLFAYDTLVTKHGDTLPTFYEPRGADWSDTIACPPYLSAYSLKKARQESDELRDAVGVDGHEDFENQPPPQEEACTVAPLSARGFRSDQSWDRYKPQVNGERCVEMDSSSSISRPPAPRQFVSQSRHLFSGASKRCSPLSWTTTTTTPSCFIETWFLANAATAHDENNIWCLDLPRSWEEILESESGQGNERSLWTETSTAHVTLQPRERYLMERGEEALRKREREEKSK